MAQGSDGQKLKRRDFLALGAAGVAGMTLAGSGGSELAYAAETKAPLPTLMLFPGNYTWSAAARGVISGMPRGGGDMGEIYKVCATLQDKPADNAVWFTEWNKMGEHVAKLGDEAKAKGYLRTASGAYLRAAHYIQAGERLRQPRTAETQKAYARSIELFKKGIVDIPFLSVEAVEVPFEGGKSLPAYFIKRRGEKRKLPTVVFFDGLDVTKEIQFFRAGPEFAQRDMALLIIDAPGNGESVRFRGMPARHDSEVAGGAAIDYLEKRADVDKSRIGVMGICLGGYFAPRAAAYEKRFKACVAWGAQYDVYAVWKKRIDAGFKGASLSVPGEHILWFLGVNNLDQALERLKPFTLEGAAQKLQCPFLLTHGEKDAQVATEIANTEFAAIGSKDKTFRVFTEEEGGSEHCQGDNVTLGITYIVDWFTEKMVKA
jgi:dipeptidyl aminopeptidase/acylaminoacyl peptidase